MSKGPFCECGKAKERWDEECDSCSQIKKTPKKLLPKKPTPEPKYYGKIKWKIPTQSWNDIAREQKKDTLTDAF